MINNSKTINPATTIVFIDTGVENSQQLIEGVIPSAEVFVLDKTADGIEQISEVLQQRQNIDAVHIISHGSPGCLYLGNSQLSLDNLIHYTPQLQQWNVTNLLLYGCNVAAGDAGEEFITKLHALTGSEIAASKSLTGSAAKGGNWELEVTTGKITSPLALQSEVMATYSGVMAVVPETEPNNSIATAQVIATSSFTLDSRTDIQNFGGTNISTTVPHATINGTGDGSADYFKITVSAGQPFIFDVDGSNFDADLTLYDINGNLLAYHDGEQPDEAEVGNTPSTDSYGSPWIDYTFSTAGDYVIKVDDYEQPEFIDPGVSYTLHIVASAPIVPINGTANNDILNGTANADQINGLVGSDVLYGKAGNDTIDGGDGNDIAYGGNNDDLLNGGNGSDRLYGDAGNDTLYGDAGNDILYGGDGDDLLDGGAGSDQLYGNGGIDTFVLASGMGLDSIYNFQDDTDLIKLDGGLTFGDLNIVSSGTNTLIKVLATGVTLASLQNISSGSIGAADFVSGVPVPLVN